MGNTGKYYKTSVEGKTQADGSFYIDVSDSLELGRDGRSNWGIQVVVHGTPTAGTLKVEGRLPDAPEFGEMADPIDMVNGPFLVGINKPVTAFQFTPSGFDGTSYSVYLCAV